MIPVIGPLIALLTTGVEKYAEHQKVKAEGKIEAERARNRRIANLDAADANWDKIMAEGSKSSWKDEYWTIVLSIPAILAFFPDMVPAVEKGFAALEKMPDWYRYALGIAIAAAFGFRQVTKLMGGNKQ